MDIEEYLDAVGAVPTRRWSAHNIPTPPHLLGALTRHWRKGGEGSEIARDPLSPPRGRVVVLSPRRSAPRTTSNSGVEDDEYERSLGSESDTVRAAAAAPPTPRDRGETLTRADSPSGSIFAAALDAVDAEFRVLTGEARTDAERAFRDELADALTHGVTGSLGRDVAADRSAIVATLYDALTEGTLADMANLDLVTQEGTTFTLRELQTRLRRNTHAPGARAYEAVLLATVLGVDVSVFRESPEGDFELERVYHPLNVSLDDFPPRNARRGNLSVVRGRDGAFHLLVERTAGGVVTITAAGAVTGSPAGSASGSISSSSRTRAEQVPVDEGFDTRQVAPPPEEEVTAFALALTQRLASPDLRQEFVHKIVDAVADTHAEPRVTLDDIPGEISYVPGTNLFRTSRHIGQRKLFLSELQFGCDIMEDAPGGEDPVVIYAGAAPGNHTGFLSKLFPRFRFILVDPNPFRIVGVRPVYLRTETTAVMYDEGVEMIRRALVDDTGARVFIIAGLFTHDLARATRDVAGDRAVYFISDIRTNVTGGEADPDTADILWNSAQQLNWTLEMKPRLSMFKFRHPFYVEDPKYLDKIASIPYIAEEFERALQNGVDFIANARERRLEFFDGEVRLQAFAGPSSTETRLVTDGTRIVDWGTPEEYENRFFYFNNVDRPWVAHRNENADLSIGFDHCNDCALENSLWKRYLASQDGRTRTAVARLLRMPHLSVRALVVHLSQITSRSLVGDHHGRGYSWAELTELANRHSRFAKAEKKKGQQTPFARYLL